jgi:hypothetical protein
MADLQTLYAALRKADEAGDKESAQKLADYIRSVSGGVTAPPKPAERTFGEAAKDIAAGVVSGAGSLVQLPGQLYGLATGDFSKTGALGLGEDISKYGEEMKSAALKAKEAERGKKIAEAEKSGQWEAFKTAFGETIKDPALLTSFLAEQAPQLLVPFGAAKVARGAALAGGAGELAAGGKGVLAAKVAGAVQQGADVGAQAYEDIYKNLVEKGATPEDAAKGAINLARATGAGGAVISFLAQNLPGAQTIEEAFAGVPGKAGRLIGGAKGALGEAGSEIAEEVGGKLAQNIALQQVAPETSLTAGLGQTAALAAIGGGGMGGVTGLVRTPAAKEAPAAPPAAPGVTTPPVEAPPGEAPVGEAPPTAPPSEAPPAVTPPVISKPPIVEQKLSPEDLAALENYTTGSPEDMPDIFSKLQNRDRSTPASIQQVQNISANPDYDRLTSNPDFGQGAPVVISDVQLPAEAFGAVDVTTASDGRKIPVRYAAVEAGELLASNAPDGSVNPGYADIETPAVRVIAGNGRVAGLQSAYANNTADNYKQALLGDVERLGLNPEYVAGLQNPVLVRLMPQAKLTADIGDVSNVSGQMTLSSIEQAKNDGNRIDIGGLNFQENGLPTTDSLIQFVRSMPAEEAAQLVDKNGMPTSQAIDRLNNAIFYKAYGSDSLIDLYAQAADPEAKQILSALARSAPKMAVLEGAGDYDLRPLVIQAAEAAVNARRQGVKLTDFVKQADMEMDPNARPILDMFAENSRSGKRMGDILGDLADRAAEQTKAGPDMFGEVPKIPVPELLKDLGKNVPPDLLTPKEEPKSFEIQKPKEQIAKEITGMRIPELSQWAIDNAPNSAAKAIAEAVHKTIVELDKRGVFPDKIDIRNGSRTAKTFYGRVSRTLMPGTVKSSMELNGLINGKAHETSGTRYTTILHELLHAALATNIEYVSPKIKNDLRVLLNKVREQVKQDQAKGVKHPFLDMLREKAHLKNEHELISYGLTIDSFQDYLSKIKVGPTNAMGRLVQIFRQMLNIDAKYETALDALVRHTSDLLEVTPEQYKAGIEAAGGRFAKEPPVEAPAVEKPKREKPPELDTTNVPEAKGRHPQVQAAALLLKEGKLTREQFEKYVDYYRPIEPIEADKLYPPTSDQKMMAALTPAARDKLNKLISNGTRVGLRMDLPALQKGAPVVSIHEGKPNINPKTGQPYTSAGKNLSYSSTAHITDVEFAPRGQEKSLMMGVMPAKEPLQTIEGKWVNTRPEQAFAKVKELMNDPAWVQVGFDPSRHGYFYDRKTREPVKSASEVYQIGQFVLAKDVVYAPKTEYLYEEAPKAAEKEAKTSVFFTDRYLTNDRGQYGIDLKHPVTLKDKTRLDGFSNRAQTVFTGYDKNGNRITIDRNSVNPEDIVFSRDANKTAQALQKALEQLKEPKVVSEEETTFEKAKQKAKDILQKRPPLSEGAMAGLDPTLVDKSNKVFAPRNQTVIDRIEGMRDNFWQRLAQGVADQYRTIKEYSDKGYMMARMSKTIDGALEGLLMHGHVFNNQGALDIRQNTKGLFEAMKPIGKEVDRYMIWVALNREAKLVGENRAPSIDKDLVARRAEFAAGEIDGKPRLEVYQQVQKDMNMLNRSVLKIARDAGLIDEKGYERFASDLFYVPFYKVMEDGDLQNASTASGLTSQYFSKELKGGEKPFGDLMENTIRNWSHILSAAMKNQAASQTINDAMKLDAVEPNLKLQYIFKDGKVYNRATGKMVGDGSVKPEMTEQEKGAIKVMQDGRPTYYNVQDPLLLESISAIGYMGPKSKFLDVARDFKNLLQFGVTLSPAFKVRNLFRDSVQAIAISDLKKNPFANVVEGWAASDKDNPAHISALAGGAIFNFGSAYEGDQAKSIRRLLERGVPADTILDTDEKIKRGLRMAWDKYQEWGNKSEAANRIALYNQLKEKGMSHLEASFYARDLLDFSMQGAWPAFRLVTQVVPFLNARIQGLYKLGKDGINPTYRVLYNSATGKEIDASDKKKAQQFSIVSLSVALASLALYAAFKDDEEFQKREDWDRDNFWWFKLPGMQYALRVPKPFEIGAFGTLAERTAEQIFDKGAEGKQFKDSLLRMATDTFAVNYPQFIKPLIDLYANKDSFTGAPIESAGMERLSKQERKTETTSPLAIALGGLTSIAGEGLSPVQMDYAIKAYFGWLGGTVADFSHYATMPFRDGAYPDRRMIETVSAGFIKELPATQSRMVTAFYKNNKEISQAYADMRHYAELGDSEKVMKILEKNRDKIALAKFYDHMTKEMSKVRQQINIIMEDKTMSGAAKKEEIDRLKLIIADIAKQSEDARKSMKR